ncbi:MAG: TIGR01906 family membrane protein, partial [Aliifodinibius sp.]|nr:TIGR01906 family membrane protein [candidate division Zixibacteria bacterium]NIT56011.1 TIGR01906 family membrane protein [Fodinibius sp.]NIW44149.1 TIGR01906 family membrane protein [Gammaproteobacteria bacterium]NIR63221.1 TIGR01906 family membrane protein [candidate division Zixibacteria bacterium]NIS45208.1 TIGR01906 family membrane protein [candidate division Zixibacteria bacterium]
RMHWADISREYLLNDAEINFLGDLEFADGSPLYNERELKHMLDVKIVVGYTMIVFYLGLAIILGVGYWWIRTNRADQYLSALSKGGWFTVGLIVFVITMIIINFNVFFVAFHRVFFEGDTWLFNYSDTLIRLFPEVFWRDAFLMIGGLGLIIGAVVGWGAPKLHRRFG